MSSSGRLYHQEPKHIALSSFLTSNSTSVFFITTITFVFVFMCNLVTFPYHKHVYFKGLCKKKPVCYRGYYIRIHVYGGRRGRDRMEVGFTTNCASSAYHHPCCQFEPVHGQVYSIQHFVIKFVSDLRQVGGFFRLLWFPPPIKLTATIQLIYC